MKPREVVLNASPLICLSKSGLSGLLPELFEHIVVPGAVVDELLTKGSADTEIESLFSQHWLQHIRDLSIHPIVASWDLGKGESEVLSYAFEQTGYWAILDDLAARR
jgi:predicted nucleic acid-binding protein